MIVWLASYPGSGNTFARFVIQHIYGAPLPNIYQRRPPAADSPNGVRPPMFPELASGISLSEARLAADAMFVKTHELPSDDSPAIYLVRDGRDALVSHAHFVLDIDRSLTSQAQEEFLKILEQLIETDDSFGDWGNNVLAWNQRQAPTAIVRFEDLIASPAATIRWAVEKLGIPVTERQNYEIPEFSQLHARQTCSVEEKWADGESKCPRTCTNASGTASALP